MDVWIDTVLVQKNLWKDFRKGLFSQSKKLFKNLTVSFLLESINRKLTFLRHDSRNKVKHS